MQDFPKKLTYGDHLGGNLSESSHMTLLGECGCAETLPSACFTYFPIHFWGKMVHI